MVKSICVTCGIETAQTYFRKNGVGPVCYPCMQNTKEYPDIIVMGDGTKICAVDKYMMERHEGQKTGTHYLDDYGRKTPCGMFPDYTSRDSRPMSTRSSRPEPTTVKFDKDKLMAALKDLELFGQELITNVLDFKGVGGSNEKLDAIAAKILAAKIE